MKRAYAAVAATVGLFLLVQLGALALVRPFMDAGYQTVEDPSDPTNSLVYVGAILVATAFMLLALKFGVDQLLQGFIVFASVFLSFYVFSVVLPPVATVAGTNAVAVAAALVLGAGLLTYPEWYVIDAAGIVMGAGAAGLFGISFGLLPAVVLLVVLAVYDAVSVYGTEHMLTLASGVMDLRLPVVLVVPLTLSYTFLEEDGPDTIANDEGDAEGETETDAETASDAESESASEAHDPPEDADESARVESEAVPEAETGGEDADAAPEPFERDAFFIGLGDAVMPTILVASAAFFRPGDVPLLDVPGVALTVPALGAMAGTLVGLLVLMWLVMKGRAHAGLPLLNGGAIAGYLLGAVLAGVAVADALGVTPYL